MKYLVKLFGIGLLLTSSCVQTGRKENDFVNNKQNTDWVAYGGNKGGNRYSFLTQINTQTVGQLRLVWEYNTGENNDPNGRASDIQCQPIEVKGILYGTTPKMKLFAVNATTGRQLWKFNPFDDTSKKPEFHAIRGVLYWEDGNDKRILYAVGSYLYAINAHTGEKIKTFGHNGDVDLHVGLGDSSTIGHDVSNLSIAITTPGVIYKDLLITGSRVSEEGEAAPGYIRAFNVRTGKLQWTFHTIPLPGEYGYETWPKDAYKKFGGANCWAGLVLDEKRGIVYTGTGSPSVDFYGGDRAGQNLFANCVLALDASTGKHIWHFQTIHHDLWDRDLPCPPNLVTVKHQGHRIDAVAQTTKDGLVFVLDRENGTPLFPVKEVPVPTSPSLPGEQPWPTQPVPSKPAPFSLQELTEADITQRTPEARAYVLERYKHSSYGSKYMPPNMQGTLYFGFGGGAEWGGNAADTDGILYQNANNMLWWLKMQDMNNQNHETQSIGQALFNSTCAACHGVDGKGDDGDGPQAYPVLNHVGKRLTRSQLNAIIETGRGRMPSFRYIAEKDRVAIVDFLLHKEHRRSAITGERSVKMPHNIAGKKSPGSNPDFPYRSPFLSNGHNQFRDQENYPAIKPPWGTLNAIDLNTGEYLWQVPLGEYPELTKQGIPPTGTENHGGPIVTAGGLVFIAATYDENIRAFDKKTGKVVWQYKLPAGGFATPITYMVNGKQYLVIAAGGTRYGLKPGGSYVAFALP